MSWLKAITGGVIGAEAATLTFMCGGDKATFAKAKPIPAINFRVPGKSFPINPVGWVYEICYRAQAINARCPAGKATSSEFGGIRLALQVFTLVWLVGCAGWAIQVLWRL